MSSLWPLERPEQMSGHDVSEQAEVSKTPINTQSMGARLQKLAPILKRTQFKLDTVSLCVTISSISGDIRRVKNANRIYQGRHAPGYL
jgi:hypothetical protein